MKADKIKKFFEYLRTVQINESIKIDYSDNATYLKSSELNQRMVEMEVYIESVIKSNAELHDNNTKLVSNVRSLQNDILTLEREKEELISHYIDLKSKNN